MVATHKNAPDPTEPPSWRTTLERELLARLFQAESSMHALPPEIDRTHLVEIYDDAIEAIRDTCFGETTKELRLGRYEAAVRVAHKREARRTEAQRRAGIEARNALYADKAMF